MSLASYFDAIRTLGVPSPPYSALGGLFFFTYLILLFGAPFLLLGSYVLRRVTRAIGARSPYVWAGTGAVLGPILLFMWALVFWGLQRVAHISGTDLAFLSSGTTALVENHTWWLVIPAGAAASYLLCYVERRIEG